ncbi:MAG: hypothetical protein ABI555_01210 [Chloroflexota bacterium]
MDAQPPTTVSHPASRTARLAGVLAVVSAIIGASTFIAILLLVGRDDAALLSVATGAFLGGIGLLVAFRAGGSSRSLRILMVAGLVSLTVWIAAVTLPLNRSTAIASRPVISATSTLDGPVTISGNVTASSLGATERVSVKIVDFDATPFQAVSGSPISGRTSVPFQARLNSHPDRDVTILAWLTDRVSGEPSCAMSTTASSEVSCLRLSLHSTRTSAPVLTLSPSLLPGARSVKVEVAANVSSQGAVQVNLWDRDALIGSFIAHPDPDGAVKAAWTVPLHDNRAVLCAVAEMVSEASAGTVPSPCVGTTYVQLIIPPAAGPSSNPFAVP